MHGHQGFDQGVSRDLTEQYVTLDLAGLFETAPEREPPGPDGYIREGSQAVTVTMVFGSEPEVDLMTVPGYSDALLGDGSTEGEDPLVDPQGCLWASAALVLRTALGLDASADLALMSELYDLDQQLWTAFDQEWSLCMTKAGFDYSGVPAVYEEFADHDVDHKESAAATADLSCRATTANSPVFVDVRADLADEANEIWTRLNLSRN